MILILKLNLTSLSTTHILMYMFLNEVKRLSKLMVEKYLP